MIPKDFQCATADRIVEIFKSTGEYNHPGAHNHILLADEVGLGKTIIASDVVKKLKSWHLENNDDCFKVIYICSNSSIASQNCSKLGIPREASISISDERLSMQHLHIYQNKSSQSIEQLIPMTPTTSFSMTQGSGTYRERALICTILALYIESKGQSSSNLSHMLKNNNNMDNKNWDSALEYYKDIVNKCNESSQTYIADMIQALDQVFHDPDSGKHTYDEIIRLCSLSSFSSEESNSCNKVIRNLRKIFAQISLDMLDPDLVIMDEFQRFKSLISASESDSEEQMLNKKFLYDDRVKVLLLSATPYKPYSTLEELSEGESGHYQEFMQVMDFLITDSDKNAQFHTVWNNYTKSLSELRAKNLTVLLAQESGSIVDHKRQAEAAMYQCVCRTERKNDDIIDKRKAEEISVAGTSIIRKTYDLTPDMETYFEAQRLIRHLDIKRYRNFPIDYAKSSPYLLSFMDYKIKREIDKAMKKQDDYDIALKSSPHLLLKRDDIKNYRYIPPNNAKLETLWDEAFDAESGPYEDASFLMWIPASKPYYTTKGVYSLHSGYSKILVFSCWEMVPRMIATMTSYESERRTTGSLPSHDTSYFTIKNSSGVALPEEESEDIPDASQESRSKVRRLSKERKEVLQYTSVYLSKLYNPIEWLGHGISKIHSSLKDKIKTRIFEMNLCAISNEAVPIGARQMIELMRALDGKSDGPRSISASDMDTLVDIAIGSPACCAMRLFNYNEELAKKLSEKFINMFNQVEATAIIDILYNDSKQDQYYVNVLKYCVEGNLQAILDEYAYTLGSKGIELEQDIDNAFITTASIDVSMYKSLHTADKRVTEKIRTNFAVGYYNTRNTDKTIARTDAIRSAFNSPFRPFVLATTSIGQEGLDFHNYCRKIFHWNLPTNPIDLEQREGRINRYMCLAIRQNMAANKRINKVPYIKDVWPELVERASEAFKSTNSDLVPYWCLPLSACQDNLRIERIVPMYPYSKDKERYDRLLNVLSLYRLTLGQPDQEDLVDQLKKLSETDALSKEMLKQLYINLSPYDKSKESHS